MIQHRRTKTQLQLMGWCIHLHQRKQSLASISKLSDVGVMRLLPLTSRFVVSSPENASFRIKYIMRFDADA